MTDRCPECHEQKELHDLPTCQGVMCWECLKDHLTGCRACRVEIQRQDAADIAYHSLKDEGRL